MEKNFGEEPRREEESQQVPVPEVREKSQEDRVLDWFDKIKAAEINVDIDKIKEMFSTDEPAQHRTIESEKKEKKRYKLMDIAQCMAGLDSDRAWKMREELLGEGVPEGWIVIGLAGVDSDRAWEMREKLVEKKPTFKGSKFYEFGHVAESLIGLDSEQAWEMREKLIGKNPRAVAESLIGLDSEQAWEMREKIKTLAWKDKREYHVGSVELEDFGTSVAHGIAYSLSGLDSDRAWQMREEIAQAASADRRAVYHWLDKWTPAELDVGGVAGLDSERAWELREKWLRNGDTGRVAGSLAGVDSDRAWEMRERFLKEGMPGFAVSSLVLDSDRAWQMIERIEKEYPRFVAIGSINNSTDLGIKMAKKNK
jgi:hypothetical protein